MGKHRKPKTKTEKTAEWFDESWNGHYHRGRAATVKEKTRCWSRQVPKSKHN